MPSYAGIGSRLALKKSTFVLLNGNNIHQSKPHVNTPMYIFFIKCNYITLGLTILQGFCILVVMGKEKEKRYSIPVPRLQDKFIQLCHDWMAANRTNRIGLAKAADVQYPRVIELMNGNRVLTMYFVSKFIKRGIFMTKDLYDGTPESDLEKEEWDYLLAIEDRELQKKISKTIAGGKRNTLIAFLDSINVDATKE